MFEAVQKPYGNGNSGYRKYEFTLMSLVYLEIGITVLLMTSMITLMKLKVCNKTNYNIIAPSQQYNNTIEPYN